MGIIVPVLNMIPVSNVKATGSGTRRLVLMSPDISDMGGAI
jgi:hypothetical protein